MNNPENANITTIAPEDIGLHREGARPEPPADRPPRPDGKARLPEDGRPEGPGRQTVRPKRPVRGRRLRLQGLRRDADRRQQERRSLQGLRRSSRSSAGPSIKSFNCEMLEVDYDGGGVFRKYIDYMKKTRTQVLLPSNSEGRERDGRDPGQGERPPAHRAPDDGEGPEGAREEPPDRAGQVAGVLRLERILAAPVPAGRDPRGEDQGDRRPSSSRPGSPPRPRIS